MTHNACCFRLSVLRMKRLLLSLCLLLPVLAGLAHAQPAPQLQLPRVTLTAGMHLIQAQVAATPEQQAIGLMHRKEMPTSEGMLFIFERPTRQCFWMKNTLLPLKA